MIRLENIEKHFAGRPVLQKVNLEVKAGEVAVLLGPSGGGKSTLLRTINGLETFDGGRIEIGGVSLAAQASKAEREMALQAIRTRVGMVFQQFHLFPHRSVLQNVMEGPVYVLRQPVEEAKEKSIELLRRVGLADKHNAMPDQLSGGQQQRVAIARTLAMNPQAILFDEPTSALDPQMTAEVIRVMTELAEAGQTMIVVTHAMEFARNVGHSVHILHQGQVIESGSPEQVFQHPANEVTRKFLRAVED